MSMGGPEEIPGDDETGNENKLIISLPTRAVCIVSALLRLLASKVVVF